MDEEADVQIQGRGENQLSGHATAFDHHDELRIVTIFVDRPSSGVAGAIWQRAAFIGFRRTVANVLWIGNCGGGECFCRLDFHQGP